MKLNIVEVKGKNSHRMIYLIWILAYFCAHVDSDTNPCIDHETVNDTFISTNQDHSGSRASCFPRSIVPSWYRIKGIALINTVALKCPDSHKCGGSINMWINDTLPGKNDGVTFNKLCGSTNQGCCTLRNQIRVKNCNYFYVFELRRPPICDAKYCFSTTLDGLEKDTLVHESTSISSMFSTKSLRSTSTSTLLALSSGLLPSTKQASSIGKSATSTPKIWTTSMISFRTSQNTVVQPRSSYKTTTSVASSGFQEIYTSTSSQLGTKASTELQTTEETKSSSSNVIRLIVTITVSVGSAVFGIFIIIMVVSCLRKKQNTRKRVIKETKLHIKLYSTSQETHL